MPSKKPPVSGSNDPRWRHKMIAMLFLLAFLTATVHIWADYHGPRWLVYIAKPATTTVILLVAVLVPQPVSMAYQWLIVVG